MSSVLATSSGGDAGDFLLVNDFARRTGWLHGIMTAYAGYGLVLFVLFIAVGWWLARRSDDSRSMAAVAWTGIGTLIAVGLNQPIASAVQERRPFQVIPNILVLANRSTDYSFASDHATMAGAVATGLLFVSIRLGVIAWIAAVLMAFARVYVGAHFPHDVEAGLLLGAAVILVGGLVARPVLTSLVRRLAGTRLRPVLARRDTGVAA